MHDHVRHYETRLQRPTAKQIVVVAMAIGIALALVGTSIYFSLLLVAAVFGGVK